MVRAILHTPSGHELAVLNLPPTPAAPTLQYDGKSYALVGVQDGTAHYREVSGG